MSGTPLWNERKDETTQQQQQQQHHNNNKNDNKKIHPSCNNNNNNNNNKIINNINNNNIADNSGCNNAGACKCDLSNTPGNNCTCCRDCAKCLGLLYRDCCSCLGMCEPRMQVLDRTDSQVGELSEPFHQLFQALAGEKDPLLRWTTMTFPIDVALTDIDTANLDRSKYRIVPHPQDTPSTTTSTAAVIDQVTMNCTVMYLSQCTSSIKCKDFCKSTGAAAYRWFFDGCCECVGSTCINYGVNESRCIQCPMVDDAFEEDLTDHHLTSSPDHHFDEGVAQGHGAPDEDDAL
ncbi:hypothetical protein Pmani_034996 [Petrolisthes manimaculis]|uniref:Protein twisted gastrulation n=1 Tax=Petrolisthes manimaculis TaxID=1843537 RepID=A0AAE1TP40_9EUCA|nr:hypothetical protein Pmani_034996 [Petrolisthes manimaculis]